jgi:hypothetical protein
VSKTIPKRGRPRKRPTPPPHSLLTVTRADKKRPGHYYAACICGRTKSIRGSHITSGAVVSCGHARLERDFSAMGKAKATNTNPKGTP